MSAAASPRLIRLIKALSVGCHTRIKVNGRFTPPIQVQRGVLQGDPLSCVLFLIFIDDLPRYLLSCPSLRGIDGLFDLIIHLLFADDYVALLRSSSAAGRVMNAIQQWCAAWGLQVNFAVGKSHLVSFQRNPRAAPTPLPPDVPIIPTTLSPFPFLLLSKGSYQYLGLPYEGNLLIFRSQSSISGTYGPMFGLFNRCRLLRKQPLYIRNAILTQYTTVYASGVDACLRSEYRRLEEQVNIKAALSILNLGLRGTVSTALTLLMLGRLTASGNSARSAYRLFHSQRLSPLMGPPPHLRPLSHQHFFRPPNIRSEGTVARETLERLFKLASSGLLPPPPTHCDDVPRCAESAGRAGRGRG